MEYPPRPTALTGIPLHPDHRVAYGLPGQLPAPVVYEVLRLRVAVFVVEQECAYAELDGRDLDPDCRWWWITEASAPDRVCATLRVLDEVPSATGRIGRVATAADRRGRGLASTLMAHAMADCRARGHRKVVLDAQSTMIPWYAAHGFEVCGPEFCEDGIAHQPMVRELTTGADEHR